MMRDEQHGAAGVALQIIQEVDHLHLERRIERGGRLVGDRRSGSERRAMAMQMRCRMPPENWCGILRQPLLGIGDADPLQQLDGAPALGARSSRPERY